MPKEQEMKRFSGIILLLLVSLVNLQAQCEISGDLIVCAGSTTMLTGTGTPSETDPWTSSSPEVATVSNAGLVTGNSAGSVIITYTDSEGCIATATVTVADDGNPFKIPLFSDSGPWCENDIIPDLPLTSLNGITGSWTPDLDNNETTIYTFTPDPGQCATTTTLTITINPNIIPLFSTPEPYCSGASVPALPTTSTNGINGTWSPEIDNTRTTTYTFIPAAGQCATTTTLTITIDQGDTPIFITPAPYCSGTSIPPLPTTSTNGITGTWSPAIDNTRTTTYTFTPASGQCASTTTLTIEIIQPATPIFVAPGPYCSGAPIPALPTTSTNGVTGTWSPAIDNTRTTTYTFTPNPGQCATTSTLTITINPIATPTFPAPGSYCSGAPIPALPTTSTNGVTGTWSPAIDNTRTTTYTFTPNPGQCATTTTLTITINPIATPTFPAPGTYCSGAPIPALPTTSTNGVTGTWSPAIDNTRTTTYTFTPNPGQCATTTTLTITINPNTTPSFSNPGPYCSGAAIPALPTTSTNGITGSWSPAINNTRTTTYTFTPTPGICASTTTLTIVINPTLTPTFATPGPYCSGASIPALPTTSTNGVTGTWSPAINNTQTTTYTFTPNSGQCSLTTTVTIVINDLPAAPGISSVIQPDCTTPGGTVNLRDLPSSGTWTVTRSPGSTMTSGSGTSASVSGVPPGTYTFRVTNSLGCTSPSSAGVTINNQPETPAAPVISSVTQTTCSNSAGSVSLTGLPATGTWTLTRNPGNITITNSGTNYIVTGLTAGAYYFTVTNSQGCTSTASGNAVINTQPATPSAPVPGVLIQPSCILPTGSITLNGLPGTGTWNLTRYPGEISTSGSGTSTTIVGVQPGTYSFTVTNAAGCTSLPSGNIIIGPQPVTPGPPVTGTVTHPTCVSATGSVVLSGLPQSGTWTVTGSDGLSVQGTGITATITDLESGTYTFTVTNDAGCTSEASQEVSVNSQPLTPGTPAVTSITQPSCTTATGSVLIGNLPGTGTWTLTMTSGETRSGTGTNSTIDGLEAGTYTFTVTNSSGCTSLPSDPVTIDPQPVTPQAPVPGITTNPTCTIATGIVSLGGLPETGPWTITGSPGTISLSGTGLSAEIPDLAPGTYNFRVTNSDGCISTASAEIAVGYQPPTPSAPVPGGIIHPTCTSSTGSVNLSGLPETGTWTVIQNPGNISVAGSGVSAAIQGLTSGTYSFTVTNSYGCISQPAENIIINPQPPTPAAPSVVTTIQPAEERPTGSITLGGLPSGNWTLNRMPGNTSFPGTGPGTTLSGLSPGVYTFTVTNNSGCTSQPSTAAGLYLLRVYGPDNQLLRTNDTIKLTSSEPGSFTFRVETNSEWDVADNSLWLKAEKNGSESEVTVSYLENISIREKVASVLVSYLSNPDRIINISQRGRESQLPDSKLGKARLYPNPAPGRASIDLGDEEFEKISVAIADINGNILSYIDYYRLSPGSVIELDMSRFPVGQYIIRVADERSQRSFHLINF
jgi:serine protease inhibitor